MSDHYNRINLIIVTPITNKVIIMTRNGPPLPVLVELGLGTAPRPGLDLKARSGIGLSRLVVDDWSEAKRFLNF